VNNFAEIILVQQYNRVSYYSVLINGDISLFRKFFNKHSVENKEKFYHILAWIAKIGDKVGAYETYFRNEANNGDARALPPGGVDNEPTYIEINQLTNEEQNSSNDLRLYCMRANESVVFLFNGDIKTAETAQECGNVKPHFELANKLTTLIDKAIIQREIRWNTDFTDIIVEDDFILEWD
jgi:hypothetical protein